MNKTKRLIVAALFSTVAAVSFAQTKTTLKPAAHASPSVARSHSGSSGLHLDASYEEASHDTPCQEEAPRCDRRPGCEITDVVRRFKQMPASMLMQAHLDDFGSALRTRLQAGVGGFPKRGSGKENGHRTGANFLSWLPAWVDVGNWSAAIRVA
ncbi:hypothetical protein [Methylibium sp.]|uniref:hypothetical protein n=1 Tax=Methylibium sp. TaxID=2067992 RepID=UPI00286AA470|nr:hypothetical protein [Methylibium sp.]